MCWREGGTLYFSGLINWFQDWRRSRAERAIRADPLLALYGSGKKLWADEHADEYVKRLREGWED
jgi:hypothetical protein